MANEPSTMVFHVGDCFIRHDGKARYKITGAGEKLHLNEYAAGSSAPIDQHMLTRRELAMAVVKGELVRAGRNWS